MGVSFMQYAAVSHVGVAVAVLLALLISIVHAYACSIMMLLAAIKA